MEEMKNHSDRKQVQKWKYEASS